MRMDTLVLFLILGEYFQFLATENNVYWGLIIYGLYYVEVGSFYAHFLKCFLIINGGWILSKAFSASIEMIIWLLSFNLLIWYITLVDLCTLKNPCIREISWTYSWCMSFIMCLMDSGKVVCYSHLLKNFPQLVVIHTVKGFGIVSKAEVDVFL